MQCRKCKNEIPDGSIFCNWCGEKQLRERKKKTEIKVPEPRQLPSGRWTVQLRREGTSVTEDTKDLCIAKAQAVRAGFVKIEKRPGSALSLKDCIKEYVKANSNILSPATAREYMRCAEKDVPDFLSQKDIYIMTSSDVQEAVNIFSKTHSPKTTRNMYGIISAAIQFKRPDFSLSVNLPQKKKTETYVPTDDDIKKLYRVVAGTNLEIPVLLASSGSLRRSEICALTKSDIVAGGVKIDKAMVKGPGNKWVVKGTKTTESTRVAHLPDAVISKMQSVQDENLVDITPDTITKAFSKALDKAGVQHFRFHDLRHYWASVAHAIGMPDLYIMRNGGWSTMNTPQRVYMHLMKNENDTFSEKFDSCYNDKFTNEITNE